MLNKKHILIFILAAGMFFNLTACSNTADTQIPVSTTSTRSTRLKRSTRTTRSSNYRAPDFPDDPDNEPPQGMGFTISNEDVFEKGYYSVQFDSFSGAYFFCSTKDNSGSDIKWSLYLSDKELSEDEIKELSKTEPLLVNEGSDSIREGQWIYVLCNINKDTASSPVNSAFNLSSYRDYV